MPRDSQLRMLQVCLAKMSETSKRCHQYRNSVTNIRNLCFRLNNSVSKFHVWSIKWLMMKLPSLKNIAWGQKRWKIMNYDIFSIFVFLIIFIISLVAYSNEFIPIQFFGNETLILNDLASDRNFTLKKWNCEHPLGKCHFSCYWSNW